MSSNGNAVAINHVTAQNVLNNSNNRHSLPATLNVALTQSAGGDYTRPEPYRSLNNTSRKYQPSRNSGRNGKPRIEVINEVEGENVKRPEIVLGERKTSNISRSSYQGRVNGGYVGNQTNGHIGGTDSGTAPSSAHGGSVYSLPVIREQYWSWGCSRCSRLEKILIISVALLALGVLCLAAAVGVLSKQHPDHPIRQWFAPLF